MQRYSDKRPLRRAADPPREAAAVEGFDPITGLANPEQFHKRAEEQWQLMAKRHKSVSVVLVSIDRYSEYNEMTAKVGLCSVAQIVASQCKRRADFVGHVRDRKFAILLSEVTAEGALALVEKIRGEVEALQLKPTPSGKALTVSAGVATQTARTNRFFDSLMLTAVKGLQQAQRKGGNCVELVAE